MCIDFVSLSSGRASGQSGKIALHQSPKISVDTGQPRRWALK